MRCGKNNASPADNISSRRKSITSTNTSQELFFNLSIRAFNRLAVVELAVSQKEQRDYHLMKKQFFPELVVKTTL